MKKVFDLIKKFEQLQEKYSAFGAADTEPSWHFQNLIRKTMIRGGVTPTVPNTADGWELYSDTAGASRAARSLANAAQKVVDAIAACKGTYSELQKLEGQLKEYCWRAQW